MRSANLTRRVFRYFFVCQRKAKLKIQNHAEDELFNYDEYTKQKIQQEIHSCFNYFEQRLIKRAKNNEKIKFIAVESPDKLPDYYLKSANGGTIFVTPIIIIPHCNIRTIDRQELTFSSFQLRQHLSHQHDTCELTNYGFIIFSLALKITKVKISDNLLEKTISSLKELEHLESEGSLPSLYIKQECNHCPFKSKCFEEANNLKHLSLIPSMSIKRIAELKNRGIFTWEQLSYTYRAKKQKSHTLNHVMPLRALAIRKNKIFVNEYPTIPKSKYSIFFDIEGLPHEGYKYLIGVVIVEKDIIKTSSFWANEKSEELAMVEKFLAFISPYSKCTFFHYGRYETSFLKSVQASLNESHRLICEQVINNSFNVLSLLRTNVLFPTFSNGLKDVTTYLGFCWTSQVKTGYDSIKHRINWESHNSSEEKKALIEYNNLDCKALHLLTFFINKLKENRDVIQPSQIEKQTYNYFWRNEYAIDDMQTLLAHAYFDYQKEKVSISTKAKKKPTKFTTNQQQPYKPNTVIEITPKNCPECGASSDNSTLIRELSKKVTDIKFTANGVRRWVIKYKSSKLKCGCGCIYQDGSYPTDKTHIGFNVKAYIVYQYIFNRLSFNQIKKNLNELFSLKLSGASIYGYKEDVAKYYRPIYSQLITKIVESNVIYIDETPFKLEEGTVYGWVLSNGYDVVTLFRENRSSEFLIELLANFNGVIVCDFYSGYDRLNCKKQRCLIHLIRDMNYLLLRYSHDSALRLITSNFTELLSEIVQDIELKAKSRKWYLNKFKKKISYCKSVIGHVDCDNVEAARLQNRILKYWEELFEFVNHNDIHWNNTIAEHAIKLIAAHRNKNLKYLSIKKIEDYMTILTIYQNCEMKEKSFLRFLLSQKPEDIL